MSWAGELRQAFVRLQAGERPRLRLGEGDTTREEIGAEFNALVEDMENMKAKGAARGDVHRARNRLAGILAALHLMDEGGERLGEEESTSINDVIEEARKLDGQLRQR